MRNELLVPTCALFIAVTFAMKSEAKAQEESSNNVKISRSMKLARALELLQQSKVEVEEVFGATASRDQNKKMKEFLIRPKFSSSDGVFIVAESMVEKDDYNVEQVRWHLNWLEDSRLPYSLRGNKILYLEFLDIGLLAEIPQEIKRQRKLYKPDKNPF